jgi:hypothetical protein
MARNMPGPGSPADLDALERDAVGVRLELEVVADVHRRGKEADFLGKLLAQAADALEQLAVLALVHQRNQAVADLQAEHVHRRDVGPARLLRFRRGGGRRGGSASAGLGLLLHHPVRQPADSPARGQQQEHEVRHAGDQAQDAEDGRGEHQHLRVGEDLADELLADVLVGGRRGSPPGRRRWR